MARKPKTDRAWFETFDLVAEVTTLIKRIDICTKFSLPDQKRDVVFSYAALRLRKTREAYTEANSEGKPVSTSRRDYLATVQDTILLAVRHDDLRRYRFIIRRGNP